MLETFTTWTRRRWLVAAALAPLLAALFATAAPTRASWVAVGWWAGLLVAASVGSLVLASYVPLVGRRPDLGCTPCAAMSGVTLFGAVLAFATYGAQASAPLLAIVATGFGLVQRVTRQATCATAPRPPDTSAGTEAPADVSPAPTSGAPRR
jgi:hypothetical protein